MTGPGQWYPLSPLLFKIILEVLPGAIRQRSKIKPIHIGKEEIELSMCAGDMTDFLYRKIPKNQQKTSATNKHLQQLFAGYKS